MSTLEVDWQRQATLPNVLFIRSKHGHQAIADVIVPLLEASPLYSEHLAQTMVHALSSATALAWGLRSALEVVQTSKETWVVALVRGGGNEGAMHRFGDVLADTQVRPLLEQLAPRLLFAGGHTRDAERYRWLEQRCLLFGVVPLDVGRRFVDMIRAKGVLQRAHDTARVVRQDASGLPAPEELAEARLAREHERFALRARQRYDRMVEAAPILDDTQFIEVVLRGGVLIGFWPVTSTEDYRAVAFSADYTPYKSDSYYTLDEWRHILELAGVEQWEIEDALQKVE